MIRQRLGYIFSWSVLFSAFITICTVTYWASYPYKPIVINKIEVLTPQVGKGKPLIYRLDYCKNTDLESQVQKSYENDIIFPASIQIATNPRGCKVNKVSQIIPYELSSGRYKLKISFIYQVNPIRKVTVITYTDYFEITERD
jgi:hypothetical protein